MASKTSGHNALPITAAADAACRNNGKADQHENKRRGKIGNQFQPAPLHTRDARFIADHAMRRWVEQLVNHHVVAIENNALFLRRCGLAERQQVLRESNDLAMRFIVANMLAAIAQNEIRFAIALADNGLFPPKR